MMTEPLFKAKHVFVYSKITDTIQFHVISCTMYQILKTYLCYNYINILELLSDVTKLSGFYYQMIVEILKLSGDISKIDARKPLIVHVQFSTTRVRPIITNASRHNGILERMVKQFKFREIAD